MPKLKNIFVGWFKLGLDVFDLLSDEEKELADKRIGICTNCPLKKRGICSTKIKGEAVTSFDYDGKWRTEGLKYNGCGCVLHAKVLEESEQCPLGKW